MPELPEVEVLVRFLKPQLQGKLISSVEVHRARVIRPTFIRRFKEGLQGARIVTLERRAKYLLFALRPRHQAGPRVMIGHLGMTGRMYLLPKERLLPKHAAVVFEIGSARFVFEDTRYFGRMTLDSSVLGTLGPEPLGPDFRAGPFRTELKKSRQPIKVKLLDQSLVAGIGNIYASEALFRAGISPLIRACDLTETQVGRLWRAIRFTLKRAIDFGSTVPLDFVGVGGENGLFYYGAAPKAGGYEERLLVYDRHGESCRKCRGKIRRIVQAARSTFFCARCQP